MTNQPEEMYSMHILVQRPQAFTYVTRLSLPQPRASTHLAFLRKVGLASVDRLGRQRVDRPDATRIKAVREARQAFAPTTPPRSLQAGREVRRNTAMRQ